MFQSINEENKPKKRAQGKSQNNRMTKKQKESMELKKDNNFAKGRQSIGNALPVMFTIKSNQSTPLTHTVTIETRSREPKGPQRKSIPMITD